MILPKTPVGAQATNVGATSPEDEEVFVDSNDGGTEATTEDCRTAFGTDDSRRKSDRKRPSVDYTDGRRNAKKQKDATGAAQAADKPDSSEDQFAKLMGMIAALDSSINKKLDKQSKEISRKLSSTTSNIEDSIITIETKMHRITENMEKLAGKLKTQEQALPDLVGKVVSEKMTDVEARLAKLEGASPITTDPRKTRTEEAYWTARRSLRLSPVKGVALDGMVVFLTQNLGLEEALANSLTKSSVRRVPSRPNDRIKDEVVVQFSTIQDRDIVKAAGFRLAGTDGSMRLELPSHLLGQHRALSNAAKSLRKSRPGTKTYVKFDDEELSLVMDYRLAGGSWTRLRPDQAKTAVPPEPEAALKEVSAEEFSSLLSPASGANATPLP